MSTNITIINKMIRKHTAFKGVLDLVKSARNPYTPTINCLRTEPPEWIIKRNQQKQMRRYYAEMRLIANFYDAMMIRLGINKRAYRV